MIKVAMAFLSPMKSAIGMREAIEQRNTIEYPYSAAPTANAGAFLSKRLYPN
jgi:hypothetical protein